MYTPEMPVCLSDSNLSLAGGSGMSVLKFQEWFCGDVTSFVGQVHESAMGSDWFTVVEKRVLYFFFTFVLCCSILILSKFYLFTN
jgi:hypothetical protein